MKRLRMNILAIIFLVILFVLATLKVLFVGFDIDEQYAVTMSMRLLRGDVLMLDMWEPHQTSGFMCALLMLPYLTVTGTASGVFLYLRICGLIIHLCVFFLLRNWIYRYLKTLRKESDRSIGMCSFIISCIFFFTLPKLMFLPEFSNLQVWFLMLAVLCFFRYYIPLGNGERSSALYMILAGICMMLEVLSYPSTILTFFVCIYYIVHFRKDRGILKELAAFVVPCISGAACFLTYLLIRMKPSKIISLLPIIVSDGSHSASVAQRLIVNLHSLAEIILFALIYGIITIFICIILKMCRPNHGKITLQRGTMYFLAVTLLGQVLIWKFGNSYPNYPHVEYFFLPLLVFIFALRNKLWGKPLFAFGLIVPATSFCSILIMTNHPMLVSTPFLGISCVGAILILFSYSLSHNEEKRTEIWLLLLWTMVLLFGNMYMVRTTGGQHYTFHSPMKLICYGPAAGIVADIDTVKRYNATGTLMDEVIPDGAKVFYAGSSSVIYLQKDVEICTNSTISSPTFDEKTGYYFEMHPEKFPEYIVCDRNLSDLYNGGWLENYIEMYCEEIPVAMDDFTIIYKISSCNL